MKDLLDAGDVLRSPPTPTPEANPVPAVLGGKLARATLRLGSNEGALLLSVIIVDEDGVGEDDNGDDWPCWGDLTLVPCWDWSCD